MQLLAFSKPTKHKYETAEIEKCDVVCKEKLSFNSAFFFFVKFDQDLNFRAAANPTSLILPGSPHLAFSFCIHVKVSSLSPLPSSAPTAVIFAF